MPDSVKTAVIDASIEDAQQGCHDATQCRYLRSIANQPLISHVIDGLARSGVDSILIGARSSLSRSLARVLRDGEPWGVDISVVETAPDVHGWTLMSQLREVVSGRSVLLQPADCLFTGQVSQLRESFLANDLDFVFLVRGGAGGPTSMPQRVGGHDSIHLPRDHPEGTAVVLGPSVWAVLDQFGAEPMTMQAMVRALEAAGLKVGACEVGEHWCYSGSSEELLAANRIVLDAMSVDLGRPPLSDDTDAQGRVCVSPSARVCRSSLRGPVVIGPNAVVSDSFIGPYTAIGPRATVVGAELDYTMVMDGAEIRYPGYRLQSCVIGEGALVSKTFELPTGLRLELRPGSSVLLS